MAITKKVKVGAVVTRLIYAKPCDGNTQWYILATDKGKATGRLNFEPKEGDALIMKGHWGAYKGEKQFIFDSARPDIPDDPRTLLHYVCSRTKGIGESMEAKIWEVKGKDWKELEPGEVPKLRDEVINEFRKQYNEILLHEEQYKITVFLMSKGCSEKMAAAAWEAWESDAMAMVHGNCFVLSDLKGWGFTTVDDKVREHFDIGRTDERRIKAGIEYALKLSIESGDTIISADDLLNKARGVLQVDSQLIINTAAAMIQDGTRITGFAKVRGIASTPLANAERAILAFAGVQI